MPFAPTGKGSEQHAPREDVRIVEESDALVRRKVLSLSSLPAGHVIEGAAHDALRDLRPHLEEALAALGRIEQRRGLTDEELARLRAFRMLLEATALEQREGEFRQPG